MTITGDYILKRVEQYFLNMHSSEFHHYQQLDAYFLIQRLLKEEAETAAQYWREFKGEHHELSNMR
jgi:hypothetical protein